MELNKLKSILLFLVIYINSNGIIIASDDELGERFTRQAGIHPNIPPHRELLTATAGSVHQRVAYIPLATTSSEVRFEIDKDRISPPPQLMDLSGRKTVTITITEQNCDQESINSIVCNNICRLMEVLPQDLVSIEIHQYHGTHLILTPDVVTVLRKFQGLKNICIKNLNMYIKEGVAGFQLSCFPNLEKLSIVNCDLGGVFQSEELREPSPFHLFILGLFTDIGKHPFLIDVNLSENSGIFSVPLAKGSARDYHDARRNYVQGLCNALFNDTHKNFKLEKCNLGGVFLECLEETRTASKSKVTVSDNVFYNKEILSFMKVYSSKLVVDFGSVEFTISEVMEAYQELIPDYSCEVNAIAKTEEATRHRRR